MDAGVQLLEIDGMNPALKARRRDLFGLALTGAAGGSALTSVDASVIPHKDARGEGGAAAARQSRREPPIQEAIDACLERYSLGLRMTTTVPSTWAGVMRSKKHLRLMLNCAELCQTSTNLTTRDWPLHFPVHLIRTEACDARPKSCEQVGMT